MNAFPSVAGSHRLNGDRHKLKGLINSIMGRPAWAAFSYQKMLKNYERANSLDEFSDSFEEETKWYLVRAKIPGRKQ